MVRTLALALALTGSLLAATARANAPIADQVRAIEDEYRQQSNGRRIPDAQLEFYLDQIATSNWGVSKIRNDIARALGNDGKGSWRAPASWRPQALICTSSKQYHECRAPFDAPATLSQQLSGDACTENANWGSRPGVVWVDAGCRGRFEAGPAAWPQWSHRRGRRILCESEDSRYQQCQVDFGGPAQLSKQVSNSECAEGRSWGQAQGMVWVSRGCRAWFEDTRPGGSTAGNNRPASNYHITCASTDSKFRSCEWNDRYGLPKLIEQMSSSACEENKSWGYRNGSVWVDNGCRARFGPR